MMKAVMEQYEVLQGLIFRLLHGRRLYDLYKKDQFRPRKQLRFEVNLADHCNLNCFGCMHFSPLVSPWYIDPENFRRDCQRLQNLSYSGGGGYGVSRIHLMGGEPLLHPSLNSICGIARNCFPEAEIYIITNGLLLQKQDTNFWNNLAENHIDLITSRYPLNLDYDSIKQTAQKMNVRFFIWRNTNDQKQTKIPLDLNGRQNPQKSFYQCHRPNLCIQLRDGKLYPCVPVPYIQFFNSFFNKDLKVSSHDYIDIYKARSMKQIMEFLCKPIPFCRYCNNNDIVRDIDWSVSKKEITEWT